MKFPLTILFFLVPSFASATKPSANAKNLNDLICFAVFQKDGDFTDHGFVLRTKAELDQRLERIESTTDTVINVLKRQYAQVAAITFLALSFTVIEEVKKRDFLKEMREADPIRPTSSNMVKALEETLLADINSLLIFITADENIEVKVNSNPNVIRDILLETRESLLKEHERLDLEVLTPEQQYVNALWSFHASRAHSLSAHIDSALKLETAAKNFYLLSESADVLEKIEAHEETLREKYRKMLEWIKSYDYDFRLSLSHTGRTIAGDIDSTAPLQNSNTIIQIEYLLNPNSLHYLERKKTLEKVDADLERARARYHELKKEKEAQ